MTRSLNPIIVGTDGSPGAEAAVQWAAQEAVLHGLALELIAVAEPDWIALAPDVAAVPTPTAGPPPEHLEAQAARVRKQWPDLQVTTRHLAGTAASALIRESDRAAMVVVGARGRATIAEALLGSVSRHVSAHAHSPVVVVHEIGDRSRAPVAVGVDGSRASEAALRTAATEASLRGTSLLVVHAWRDRNYTGYGVYMAPLDLSREMQAGAEALAAREVDAIAADFPGLDVLIRVIEAHPTTALIEASYAAQLVVVGAHGRGHFPGMRQGSVTTSVVHGASCPVLVVPGS